MTVSVRVGGSGSASGRQGRQHVVEPGVALLGRTPVALDPGGHEVEHLGLEVDGPALRVAGARDQAGVLEHPQVLGHRLQRHVVRRGQLADRGVGHGEPGDEVATGRVGERREHPGEHVDRHRDLRWSTNWLRRR